MNQELRKLDDKKFFLEQVEKNIETLYNSQIQSLRWEAQKFLSEFQFKCESLDIFYLLINSGKKNNIFFGLQIFDQILSYKWKFISFGEKKFLFSFLVKKIFSYASHLGDWNEHSPNINKINSIFVRIVGKENKENFATFLSELTSSAKISELICENNLKIIQMVIEEIQEKNFKKGNFEFFFSIEENLFCLKRIENLCCFIFQQSGALVKFQSNLLIAALNTFEKILTFSKFSNSLILPLSLDSLVSLCSERGVRNHAISCLLELENACEKMNPVLCQKIMKNFTTQFQELIPLSGDFLIFFGNSEHEIKYFIMNSMIFFFRIWMTLNIHQQKIFWKSFFLVTQQFFLKASCLPQLEIFKVCLEWWDLFFNNSMEKKFLYSFQTFSNLIFSDLILVLIGRMAKPEEILIRENENGEIIREITKDTESSVLYERIKKILIKLTEQDPTFTQHTILKKLSFQFENKNWSRGSLNTICWSVGSISGIFPPEEEKKFLVSIIKDLLYLCELKKGKDNKAVIASNIMFVVGAYPQFLKHHWKFLKTVLQKLFEFMKENHPGIQDMACDTFLKIGNSCGQKISSYFENDEVPLIEEILEKTEKILNLLEFRQKKQFLEGISSILLSTENSGQKNIYISKIFEILNKEWFTNLKFHIFSKKNQVLTQISTIIKLNQYMGDSLKSFYSVFLEEFIKETYFIYTWASEQIIETTSNSTFGTSNNDHIEILINLRKDFLGLIGVYYFNRSFDPDKNPLDGNFQTLVSPVLFFYEAFAKIGLKEPEVLDFGKEFLKKLRNYISAEILRVFFFRLFVPSLKFVKENFEENLEIRKEFFDLIKIFVFEFFSEIFNLNKDPVEAEKTFELIIHSLIWGFKHPHSFIAKNSLESLLQVTSLLNQESLKEYFFFKFTRPILNDVFAVMIDGLHLSCFRLQCELFFRLIQLSKAFPKISELPIFLADLFSNTLPENNQKELNDITILLLNETKEVDFQKKILFITKVNPVYLEESDSEN